MILCVATTRLVNPEAPILYAHQKKKKKREKNLANQHSSAYLISSWCHRTGAFCKMENFVNLLVAFCRFYVVSGLAIAID